VELQALPSRIRQVRRIVSAQLRYWHLDPLIDHAALGVTELLANVHRHAEPDKMCTVEIELLLDRLTVSVHDHDPRLPAVREADISATAGRGLALIAAVSESWGVRPQGEMGKIVWFTLSAPTPAVVLPPYPVVYGASTEGPLTGTAVTADTQNGIREHAAARSAVAG
jgi:anti-sigma regulatory factor (Ser/Thr protein kinase)